MKKELTIRQAWHDGSKTTPTDYANDLYKRVGCGDMSVVADIVATGGGGVAYDYSSGRYSSAYRSQSFVSHAIRSGHNPLAIALIEAKVPLDSGGDSDAGSFSSYKSADLTCLVSALSRGQEDVASALLAAGADVNLPSTKVGSYDGGNIHRKWDHSLWPLGAAYAACPGLVQILLDKGADPEKGEKDYRSGVEQGYEEVSWFDESGEEVWGQNQIYEPFDVRRDIVASKVRSNHLGSSW